MKKRICLLALCLCLAAGAFPVGAAPETEAGQICQDMIDDYHQILENTNMVSLQGYCGLMASWQLYFLGVNDWVQGHHGKDQFDAYCNMAVTSGGHRITTYSYQDFTLEEALNTASRNGTRNVYNILVGFEKTNTSLGAIFGHSLVIYAILDGTVYFTEGFNTPMGRAGTPMQASIADFAAYYQDWTVFEGVAVFGKKGYVANCTVYAANMFAEVTEQTAIYSQPALPEVEEAKSAHQRDVTAGERIRVNALFENPQGQFFYQVDDSGTAGYVPAEAAVPFRFCYEDVEVSNLQLPRSLAYKKNFTLTGRIAAQYSAMGAVSVTVTDEAGNMVFSHALAKRSGVYDLESDTFNRLLDFRRLSKGAYRLEIRAKGRNHYVEAGAVRENEKDILVVSSGFRIGEGEIPADPLPEQAVMKDGWLWENGKWYFYEKDVARTGWYCYHGGDYYFGADGAAVTGWVTINGQPRFFSTTGSMRTGWLETEQGTMYLQFNGAPATGTRTIDGKTYTFDEKGILQ